MLFYSVRRYRLLPRCVGEFAINAIKNSHNNPASMSTREPTPQKNLLSARSATKRSKAVPTLIDTSAPTPQRNSLEALVRGESCVADFADKRFIPSVDVHVCLEALVRGESCVADFADKRFYRSISLTAFNNTNPQEDTNQAEASTTNTLNNVSTIAKKENRLQLNPVDGCC
jgi:hypothetical protein